MRVFARPLLLLLALGGCGYLVPHQHQTTKLPRRASRAAPARSPATMGEITGDLTLHGVTAPVTLNVTFNGGGSNLLTGSYTLGFEARGTVLRSTFGLGAYAPAIGDEVLLEIHAEFLQSVTAMPGG